MNANMNPNSLFAYKALQLDGTVSEQQGKILDLLADGVARTSRQIANALGIERTSVTGRVNKLKAKKEDGGLGLITVDKNDICPTTNKKVEFYKLVWL